VHLVPPIVDLGFLYPKLSNSSTDNILWRNSRFCVRDMLLYTKSTTANDLKLWVGS